MNLGRRIVHLWRRDSAVDIAEELRFHLDATADEEVARGMAPSAARAAAERRFGDLTRISHTLASLSEEGDRIMGRKEWFEALVQDARFGARQLRKHPGFSAVALLTLALGIGASTAIFSLVYSVLLRPLPYQDVDHVVSLGQVLTSGDPQRYVPVPNFLAWEAQNRTLSAIGATDQRSMTLTGRGDPLRLRGNNATSGYWRAAYLPPRLGRYYDATADHPGSSHVVVLSYATWQTAFGGDTTIIGQLIHLDGEPYTVVAVAPDAFSPTTNGPAFWTPFETSPVAAAQWGDHELTVTGRLKPGVTAAAVVADLGRIESAARRAHPDDGVTGGIAVRPLLDATVGVTNQRQLLILLAAVGLVLLIACGNVANLLLARAVSRRGEITVRRALGAGRGRLVRQLMVESGILAAGGVVLGVGVAALGLRLLLANAPAGVPRLKDASLDTPALLFAIAVAALSALLFGLMPALQAAGRDLQTTIRESGRDSRGGREPLRRGLIVGEIALALVLLTGAGLLLRSAARMHAEPTGFVAGNLLTARVALPESQYATDAAVVAGFDQVLTRVRAVPGVASAAFISRVPIGGGGADCTVAPAERPYESASGVDADFRSVSDRYFSTMESPVLRGRAITAADDATAPPIVMINASLATKLFGNANPIGRQVRHCIGLGNGYSNNIVRTVVGVFADVRANGLDQEPVDQVFYPVAQFYERQMTLVVRGSVPVTSLVPSLRRAVAAVDPQLPLAAPMTMDDVIRQSTAVSRFTMLLLLVLGVSGLCLAATGIYGVVSYQVAQRVQEMGIRLALGATPGQVRGLVLRNGLTTALIGVAIGEGAAVVGTRALRGLVYGITTRDPVTFVSVGGVLALTALVASIAPALRATRIDPVTALRGE
jgi:predicted permease